MQLLTLRTLDELNSLVGTLWKMAGECDMRLNSRPTANPQRNNAKNENHHCRCGSEV